MRYFLELDLDNAAFEDNPGLEVARILREVADRVDGYSFRNPRTVSPLRDINGNRVGQHGTFTAADTAFGWSALSAGLVLISAGSQLGRKSLLTEKSISGSVTRTIS